MKKCLALLPLLLFACDKAPDIDKSKYPSAPSEAPMVDMKSTGDGDKAPLRMRPKAGATQDVTVTMDMSGSQLPASMDMTMELSAVVLEVRPDETFDVEVTIDDASMAGMPGGASVGDMLGGLSIVQTMTPRGNITDFRVSGGGDMMAGMDQLLDQSLGGVEFFLPEEEVSEGAKWEVRSLEEEQGFRVYQTMTYTVSEIDGDLVTLDVDLDQRAKDQAISSGMGSADLEYLHTTGGGNMVIDLAKAMPTSAKLHGDMKMKVSAGGDSQKVDVSFDIGLTSR